MMFLAKRHTNADAPASPWPRAAPNGAAMIKIKSVLLAAVLIACGSTAGARAEAPEEWVTLGARVHGAFGSFVPVGIRIGLDALKRLDAQPRGVTVVYYSGPKAPCPCPVDGIAIATMASAGQGTLHVAPEKAPEDAMGVAVIRSKATGAGFKYTIAASWLPKLIDMNKQLDPLGRYNAVMNAPDLFSVEPVPAAESPPK
jgi:formylmethanofuran dehydrogenase subunit E